MNGKIIFMIILVSMALFSGCSEEAAEGEPPQVLDEQTPVVAAQETSSAIASETPDPGSEQTAHATEIPATATQVVITQTPLPSPSPTATATEEPEIVYTKDPDPCVRPVPEALGDAGGAAAGIAAAPMTKHINRHANSKLAINKAARDPILFGGGGGGLGLPPVKIEEINDAVLLTLEGNRNNARFVEFSYDGRLIVTSDSWDISIWNSDDGELLATLEQAAIHAHPAVSAESPTMAVRSNEGFEIWNLDDLQEGPVPIPINTTTKNIAISPDGRWLAAANGETANLWDVTTGEIVQQFTGEVFSEETFDNGTSYPTEIGNGHADLITALTFSPNGQALFSSAVDGTVRIWDLATGEHLRCLALDEIELPLRSAALTPDGRYLAADTAEAAYIWNAVSGELSGQIDAQEDLIGEFGDITFSPDGSALLISHFFDRAVYQWELADKELIGVFRHPSNVNTAAFNADGDRLVVGMDDGFQTAWVWDAKHSNIDQAGIALNLITEGRRLQAAGKFEEMFVAYEEAHQINPDTPALLGAYHWNQVCWYGSLLGRASEVLPACEMAVEGAPYYPDYGLYRDSRGLARALHGDTAGAIEDFAFFVESFDYVSDYEERVELRLAWIEELRQGVNPFDEETLEVLRSE